MAATKMFFRSGFDMQSSGLPGSRLDFLEVVWTSWKPSGLPGSRLDFMEVF
ncbi:hypothetical protein F2Q69_00049259 [Brassica cretica]|uniref:Uncharacterized protein n=1 Tax=Brassica cretica TaxID=69181 RepID=A0A8S9PJK2_BRACR|nr:hypothetical protein F2Q69_00049259 [Brassica cretica]